MRAVVIPAVGRIELHDVPEPVVGPGRLIVEVGALDAMLAGAIDARRMVTHTFPLDGFEDALETLRRGEGMKAQIAPNG